MAPGPGYPIDPQALDLELYQLACTFAASSQMERLARRYPELRALRGTFELSEAARRLIAIAVALRNGLDTRVEAPAMLHGPVGRRAVGILIQDLTKPRHRVPLQIREACNKIIHADAVDFFCGKKRPRAPVGAVVRLFGAKGEKEWEAHLELFAFIATAHWLV